MNKIIFNDITIQNFKSIGPEIKFNFNKHQGLNYIYGVNKDIDGTANGVGKSTIFVDAILFALFGKTLKNTKNEYIPNRIFVDKKIETCVKLNFTVNDKSYTSVATIKKAGYPVAFRLFENGIDISKSTTNKTKEFLKKEIIKCSFGLFVNSIILSASNSYNFFNMNKAQKREYIENIFKITCFGEMLKLIRIDINNLNRQTLLEQQEQRQYQDNLDTYRKNYHSFKQDKLQNIENIQDKISNIEKEIETLTCKLIDSTPFEDKLDIIQTKLEKIENKRDQLLRKYIKNDTSIRHINEDLIKYQEIIDMVCEDCKTKLGEGYFKELENNIKSHQNKNKQINKKLDTILEAVGKLQDAEKKIKNKINQIKKENNIISQNQITKQHKLESIIELKQQIDEVKKQRNPFKKMINDTEEKFKNITEILENHYQEKTELEVLEFVVSDDGAKKFMIKDLIKVLNTLVRHYLEEMGAQFTIHFDDSFDCTFLTNTGECDYSSFSAGERQRINIATLFAFRDILGNNGIDSNIFVLDEIIDTGIDEYALKAILNILQRQSLEKNQTVYIVSHRPETVENGMFDNIIEITKQHSVSKITIDSQGDVVYEN